MRNHFLRAKGVAAAASVETAPTVSVNNNLNTDEWTRITQRNLYNYSNYCDGAVDKEGDGSIYLLMDSGGAEYKLLKMTQSGAITWQKDFDYPSGTYYQLGTGMTVDNNGNLIMLGYYKDGNSTVTNGRCPLILRVNSDGSIAWAYKFGTGHHTNSASNASYSVVVNKDNDIFVTGVVRGATGIGTPFIGFLLRLTQTDSAATLQWYKALEDSTTSGYLEPQGLATISNSEYVYFLSNKNTNAWNISRIKYDASSIDNQFIYRNSNWTQNNSNHQYSTAADYMHIDANGNFYLTFSHDYTDSAVIKLDIDLNMEWAKEIASNSSTYSKNTFDFTAIGATDNSGDVLFACETVGNSTDSSNYPNLLLISFDSDGDFQWDKIITSLTTNDGANTTQVTTTKNGRYRPYYLDGDTKDNFYLIGFFPGWRYADAYDFQHQWGGGVLKHQSGTEVPAGSYTNAASGHHYYASHSNPPTHWTSISDTTGYTYSTGSWTSSSTSPSASYGGVELQDFPANSGTWALTDVSSNIDIANVATTEQGWTYKDDL